MSQLLVGIAVMLALVTGIPWLRKVMGFALPDADAFTAMALMLGATMLWLTLLRHVPVLGRTSMQGRAGR
jgi:Ca2+-transporting ATPase